MSKVALITGASRGIGLGIAKQLASEGYRIAITGTRDNDEIVTEFKAYDTEVIYLKGNIGNEKDRTHVVDAVIEKYGRIDVLVNNAGVGPKSRLDILETTRESVDFVIDTNVKGTFFLTQYVANIMKDQTNEQMPKIINISSISAYTSSTSRGEYCIAKAGISMITTLFADRLAEEEIRVYEIRPGIIKTDLTAGVSDKYDNLIREGITPIKRWGLPEDIAGAVSLLCSSKMNFSTGEVINVDGGFHLRRL